MTCRKITKEDNPIFAMLMDGTQDINTALQPVDRIRRIVRELVDYARPVSRDTRREATDLRSIRQEGVSIVNTADLEELDRALGGLYEKL